MFFWVVLFLPSWCDDTLQDLFLKILCEFVICDFFFLSPWINERKRSLPFSYLVLINLLQMQEEFNNSSS